MKITLKHVSYISPNLKPSFIYQEQSGFFLLHAINNGVGSKIGVVRSGTREVDVAVLCAKAVRPDVTSASIISLAQQYTTVAEDI